jgi:hypothetical protein
LQLVFRTLPTLYDVVHVVVQASDEGEGGYQITTTCVESKELNYIFTVFNKN